MRQSGLCRAHVGRFLFGLAGSAIDLLEQPALAVIVDLRFVVAIVAERRIALEELAPLAQLALEDAPEVRRILMM